MHRSPGLLLRKDLVFKRELDVSKSGLPEYFPQYSSEIERDKNHIHQCSEGVNSKNKVYCTLESLSKRGIEKASGLLRVSVYILLRTV